MIDIKNEKLEIYKEYVLMSDKHSVKRNQSNAYFITIISGIFIGYAYVLDKKILQEYANLIQFSISILGLVLCFAWKSNIISYKELSIAKFRVIHEMEKQLAFAPFTKEWEIVRKNNQKYKQITKTETIIPIICLIPFIALLINSFIVYLR